MFEYGFKCMNNFVPVVIDEQISVIGWIEDFFFIAPT